MRLRICAIAATITVLTYLAFEHRSELPALPNATALMLNLRNQATPFRFTLATEPESPSCDTPITLKVHVIDADGSPADGLIVDADASVGGEHEKHAKLRGKGHGDYEGRMELDNAGSWELNLNATKGFTRGRQRLSIEVGAAQTPSEPNEDDS